MFDMLRDKGVSARMERDGAVVVPFLSDAELEAVREFYSTIRQQYELQFTEGMHMTLWHNDYTFKRRVQDGVLSLLKPAYERLFADSRRLNNIFMVKQAHTMGEFAMHNDWSIVDERQHQSMNVWIPLQDTTRVNGALWVIRGSHKLDMPIRGGGALLPDFSAIADLLDDFRSFLPAKAGEAVLFFHKTIHGSSSNVSDTDRVICTFSVIPQSAALRICFQKDSDSPLEIYEPADDFNYKYDNLLSDTNTAGPGGTPSEIYTAYRLPKFSIDDILPFIVKAEGHATENI